MTNRMSELQHSAIEVHTVDLKDYQRRQKMESGLFRTCSGIRAHVDASRRRARRRWRRNTSKTMRAHRRASVRAWSAATRAQLRRRRRVTKVALILGVTGQTGSYLTDLLLSKGYIVHGLTHSTWQNYPSVLRHVMCESSPFRSRFVLHQGDILGI